MVAMRFWLRSRGHAGRLGLDDVSTLSMPRRNHNVLTPTVRPPARLDRSLDVHSRLRRLHPARQRRPPRLGRQARPALLRRALHVARAILLLNLQRVHQSLDPVFLPPSGNRHLFEKMVLLRLVRHRFYDCVHDRLLHHAARRLQTDQSLLDGV